VLVNEYKPEVHLRGSTTKCRGFFPFLENAKSKAENILLSIQNDVFAKTALFYGVFGTFSTNFVGRAGKYWERVNDFLPYSAKMAEYTTHVDCLCFLKLFKT
jgi:hypothetical protein